MQLQVKVETKLVQTLRLDQIQSLEMLQMSTIELEQYLQQKGQDNPLLHVEETTRLPDIYSSAHNTRQVSNVNIAQRDFPLIERLAYDENCYERFLLEQLPITVQLNHKDYNIFLFLLRSLDDRLFLDIELLAVAEIFQTTIEHVEALLQLLQTFEPAGVGARNYIEYLLLQVNRLPNVPPLVEQMIQEDLTVLAQNKWRQLAKKYNTTVKDVQEAVQCIKKLKPIQHNYKETVTAYIVPDIEVSKIEGEWTIHLLNDCLPTVQIHTQYVELIKQKAEYELYYKQHMKDATAILLGIEKRKKTLYDVMLVLIDVQRDFFEYGRSRLNPMSLKDVATNLNVNVSTISRAVSGKYIQTPHGIYSLQSLFTKGIVSSSGKMDSVDYIKKRIQQIIELENKQKPLSDAQLVRKLQQEGIQLSRRTITKYREEMNIASSFNRSVKK